MKKTHRHRRCHKGIAIAWSVCLCCISTTAIAASSYLQELEVEAARTKQLQEQEKQPSTASEPSAKTATSGEKIAAGLSLEEFEQALQDGYYGSYLFYSTLDDKEQQNVYQDYQNDNALESIRESIKTNIKQ